MSELNSGNRLIAEFMGHAPKEEYYVGKDEASCYNPSHFPEYFPTPLSQKAECERWLNEQRLKFPNGWVTKDGYEVLQWVYYRPYHSNWSELMPVVEKIESVGYSILIEGKTCAIQKARRYTTDWWEGSDTKIGATWQAVTAFIEWYNKEQTLATNPNSNSTDH